MYTASACSDSDAPAGVFVVVGAGAGGLSTAVTAAHHGLRVVVIERADVCGGATAWSGGWMWAPGNPLARADGVVEDVEEFRTYLRAALGSDYDPGLDAVTMCAELDALVLSLKSAAAKA